MTPLLDITLDMLMLGVPIVLLFAVLMPYRVAYFAITGALVIAFPFVLKLFATGATHPTGAAVILYMGLLALCFLITHGISVALVMARRRKRRVSALRSRLG